MKSTPKTPAPPTTGHLKKLASLGITKVPSTAAEADQLIRSRTAKGSKANDWSRFRVKEQTRKAARQ